MTSATELLTETAMEITALAITEDGTMVHLVTAIVVDMVEVVVDHLGVDAVHLSEVVDLLVALVEDADIVDANCDYNIL